MYAVGPQVSIIYVVANWLPLQDSLIKETQQLMDAKKDKANTGTLFSTLLTYYHSKKEINLPILLSFPLWPEYLKHFGKLF